MARTSHTIPCTHTGSLPRPDDLIKTMWAEPRATFHGKYFQPNRIILGVVGDFDTKDMEKKIRAAFGDWPKGPDAKDPQVPVSAAGKPGVYEVQVAEVKERVLPAVDENMGFFDDFTHSSAWHEP